MVWQLSHCAVVGMWFVGLARAVVPLWQVEHLPTAVASCWYDAPVQLMVELWQVSHCAAVVPCVAGLASALANTYAPLWQLAQLPADTGPVVPVWLIEAGAKAVKFLWQVSHCASVGT